MYNIETLSLSIYIEMIGMRCVCALGKHRKHSLLVIFFFLIGKFGQKVKTTENESESDVCS